MRHNIPSKLRVLSLRFFLQHHCIHIMFLHFLCCCSTTTSGSGFFLVNNQRVRMFSNGTVQLLSPTIIKFTCKMNVAYFPFDYQVCKLKYASWSHTGHELQVVNVSHQADMSLFVDNGEKNKCRFFVMIVNRNL